MRIVPILLFSALAAALAGCASMGGSHPASQPRQASQLHATRSFSGVPTASQWPAGDWWTGLGDRRLNTLIHEALKDNPDLAMARARARAAEARAGAADAANQPQLSAGASISGARLPTTLIAPPYGGHFNWVKYGYLKFNWDLDLWGGQRDAWEAAVGRARAAAIDARAARLDISSNVARAYAHLGYAFEQRDLAHKDLDIAKKVLRLTRQRLTAGIDNQLQVQQSSSGLATARQRMAAADRGVSRARLVLSALLGKGPDRGLQIARPSTLTPAAVALPSKLPAELLGHRPDVVAARLRVQAAGKDIARAKTRFLPNISIGALAGLASGGGTSLFQLPARFYQVAPAVSLPIFEGGRLRANLAGREAERDLAVAHYNKILVNDLDDIADKLDAMHAVQSRTAAQQSALTAARETWTLAMQRYQSGIGNDLQVLRAQHQLLAAKSARDALHAEQVDLSIQMIQALGGGLQLKTAAVHSSRPSPDSHRDTP
jgi:NodT family efflux transporter outer membrane factor (OMF) lipoprotein